MKSGWILICRRFKPIGDYTPPQHLNRFNGKGWEVYLKPTEQFSGVVESYCPEYPDIDLLPELKDSSDTLKEYVKWLKMSQVEPTSLETVVQWGRVVSEIENIDRQVSARNRGWSFEVAPKTDKPQKGYTIGNLVVTCSRFPTRHLDSLYTHSHEGTVVTPEILTESLKYPIDDLERCYIQYLVDSDYDVFCKAVKECERRFLADAELMKEKGKRFFYTWALCSEPEGAEHILVNQMDVVESAVVGGIRYYLLRGDTSGKVPMSYGCSGHTPSDLEIPEDTPTILKEYIKAHQLARLPYASQKQWLKILDLLRGIDIQHILSTKRPDRIAKCDTK